MTVTLSKLTEAIVQEQMETGRYATPDEVVNHLLEEQSSGSDCVDFPEGPSETELKASLLAAVGKPTRPYRPGELVELASLVIGEKRREEAVPALWTADF